MTMKALGICASGGSLQMNRDSLKKSVRKKKLMNLRFVAAGSEATAASRS